ncbi:MAG: hypothetical protein Q7S00_03625 [bacterium]|nr:hypothetical protein [bacterium]
MPSSQFDYLYKHREARRKMVHLSGLLLLPFLPIAPYGVAIFLAVLIVFYLFLELLWKQGKKIPSLSDFAFSCKRVTEEKGVSWAPPLLAGGIGLSLLLFSFPATACGLIHACLGDSAAFVVGRWKGNKRIFYSRHKSYLGSFAYFATTALACSFYVPFWMAVTLAAIGAVLESFPLRSGDNFILPLGISFAASLLLWP